jgi:hypothetical protein
MLEGIGSDRFAASTSAAPQRISEIGPIASDIIPNSKRASIKTGSFPNYKSKRRSNAWKKNDRVRGGYIKNLKPSNSNLIDIVRPKTPAKTPISNVLLLEYKPGPKTWFETTSDKAKKQLGKEVGRVRGTIPSFVKAGNAIGKGVSGIGKLLLSGAKATRRGYKGIPAPIRKLGVAGGLVAGATALLGISIMKGAMNQSREIVYERYMQDQAVGKNMLNNTRMGLASGTSRMQDMGSTLGLSNSLSRTRHGR